MTRTFVEHDGSRKGCLAHRQYALTCDQYESLRDRCGDQCEICDLSDWAKLAIDHDASVGKWAARGLLCTTCNMNMPRLGPVNPRLREFLAQAWFRLEAARLGIRIGDYPEPPVRSVVREPTGRIWKRERGGWRHTNPYHPRYQPPIGWDRLVYNFGPINPRVVKP